MEENHYLDKILAGDAASYKYFVKKYKEMVFAVAVRIVINAQDAEEISQDAFIKAYQNLNKFDRKARFSTWLFKIVYNLALNRKRQFANKKIYDISEVDEAVFADEAQKTLQLLKTEEQRKYIEQAINTIPEDEGLALTLHYLAENSIEEICEITSWSKPNVKVKLHRGRKNLYVALDSILKTEVKELY